LRKQHLLGVACPVLLLGLLGDGGVEHRPLVAGDRAQRRSQRLTDAGVGVALA
jgi:hypothetical protein